MAKRSARRRKRKYNWPGIISAAILISAFLIIYLAAGNNFRDLLPESWQDITSVSGTVSAEPDLDTPPLSGDTAKVHFIDVGQTQLSQQLHINPATVLKGMNILVDAGENDKGDEVSAYLERQGVKTLDLVIGTHPHSDHIGGLDVVLDAYPAEKVILPVIPEKMTPTTRTYEDLLMAIQKQGLKITPAKPGSSYDFGEGKLEILGPVQDGYDDLNDFSVVCRFTFGEWSFLLTGDMEQTAEADLLAAGADVSARVLKLGHHGSSTSTGHAFLDEVNPEICVMQLGAGNSYNHPHRETVEKMDEGGYVVYRNDLNGSIVFTTDGSSCGVETER